MRAEAMPSVHREKSKKWCIMVRYILVRRLCDDSRRPTTCGVRLTARKAVLRAKRRCIGEVERKTQKVMQNDAF